MLNEFPQKAHTNCGFSLAVRWPFLLGLLLACMGCSDTAGLLGINSIKSPAGMASAQPHLAGGSHGEIVLSWLQARGERHELHFATLQGKSWSAAQPVASGSDWVANWADFPSVQPIGEQFWVAQWLVRKSGSPYAYDAFVAVSADAGRHWGAPTRLHSDASATEHGFVSIYANGQAAGAVWLDGRNMLNDSGSLMNRGMTLRSAAISTTGSISQEQLVDLLICDCCQTDVAQGPRGPIVVYRDRTESEIRDISVVRMIDDEWQQALRVANDDWLIAGCPVNGPAVAVGDGAVVVAWYTAAHDVPLVRLARSDDAGASFAAPVDVGNAEPLGRVDVVVLPDGGAAVSWMTRGADGGANLNVRRVGRSSELGPIVQVAHMAPSRPSGFPQMVQSEDRLVFAWTDVSALDSVVRTAFVDLITLE